MKRQQQEAIEILTIFLLLLIIFSLFFTLPPFVYRYKEPAIVKARIFFKVYLDRNGSITLLSEGGINIYNNGILVETGLVDQGWFITQKKYWSLINLTISVEASIIELNITIVDNFVNVTVPIGIHEGVYFLGVKILDEKYPKGTSGMHEINLYIKVD